MQANGQLYNHAALTTGDEHLAPTGQKARSVAQPDWTPRVKKGTNSWPYRKSKRQFFGCPPRRLVNVRTELSKIPHTHIHVNKAHNHKILDNFHIQTVHLDIVKVFFNLFIYHSVTQSNSEQCNIHTYIHTYIHTCIHQQEPNNICNHTTELTTPMYFNWLF
jgi:hypothetical protein